MILREFAISIQQRLRPIFVGSVTGPSLDPSTARYQPLWAIAYTVHLNYIWALRCHVAKAALTIRYCRYNEKGNGRLPLHDKAIDSLE